MPVSPEARAALRRLVRTYLLLCAALAIELIVFEFIARGRGAPFISAASLLHVLDRAAVYGVVSVGMTYVILMGGIDLSVGSVIALSGVVCAKVFVALPGMGVWTGLGVGWLAALATGAACGCVAGLFITGFRIPPFIATLALMSSVRGFAFILVGGVPIAALPDEYAYPGRQAVAGVPIDAALMLLTFAVGIVILNGTRFGRHVRAIGGNEESARLSGIPVARVKVAVYTLCGTLAALGGLLLSSELKSGNPRVGVGDELEVIAAVVVGGTSLSGGRGTIGGTFLGLLIISVLRTGLNWIDVGGFVQQIILGAVILAAVLLDRLRSAP